MKRACLRHVSAGTFCIWRRRDKAEEIGYLR